MLTKALPLPWRVSQNTKRDLVHHALDEFRRDWVGGLFGNGDDGLSKIGHDIDLLTIGIEKLLHGEDGVKKPWLPQFANIC